MVRLFLLLLLLTSSSILNASTLSAFELFEVRFKQAEPTFTRSELQLGKLWHCSGSLQAARGHYRYVQVWRPLFVFTTREGQVINVGPHYLTSLDFNPTVVLAEMPLDQRQSSQRYEFRVTNDGDLLVAVSEPIQISRGAYRQVRRKKEVPQKRRTIKYFMCENPTHHGDREWESGSRYWSQD